LAVLGYQGMKREGADYTCAVFSRL
jgi:hypothetical protein